MPRVKSGEWEATTERLRNSIKRGDRVRIDAGSHNFHKCLRLKGTLATVTDVFRRGSEYVCEIKCDTGEHFAVYCDEFEPYSFQQNPFHRAVEDKVIGNV